jgi:hypothetical protein
MRKQLTIKDALTIFLPLCITLIMWAINVHTRVITNEESSRENKIAIERNFLNNEKTRDLVDENYKTIHNKLDAIIFKLGDKQNK